MRHAAIGDFCSKCDCTNDRFSLHDWTDLMKEYLIHTDSGFDFGVYGINEDEAYTTAVDILEQTMITKIEEITNEGL